MHGSSSFEHGLSVVAQRGQQEKREFLGEGPVSQQHTCSCTERSYMKWAEEVIIE